MGGGWCGCLDPQPHRGVTLGNQGSEHHCRSSAQRFYGISISSCVFTLTWDSSPEEWPPLQDVAALVECDEVSGAANQVKGVSSGWAQTPGRTKARRTVTVLTVHHQPPFLSIPTVTRKKGKLNDNKKGFTGSKKRSIKTSGIVSCVTTAIFLSFHPSEGGNALYEDITE